MTGRYRLAAVSPELIVCVVALGALVAQAPVIDTGLGSLIGNIGIVGVLVWHLWYHTTRSYPNMLDKFGIELEKMRAAFRHEQEAQRVADAAEQAELRAMLIQSLQAMRTAVHDVKDTAQVTVGKVAAIVSGADVTPKR